MSPMRTQRLKQGLAIGSVGAVSAFVVESVIRRVPAISVCPLRRALARVILGGVAASLADAADAPEAVGAGILVGPVMTSALDLGGTYIGGRGGPTLGGGQPSSLPVPVVVQMGGVMPTVESSIDAAIATLESGARGNGSYVA